MTLCLLATTSLTNAQTEYIVTVDPVNANVSKIDSIPSVKWIYTVGAYNEFLHTYTFSAANDLAGPFRLYTIDATDGHIISNPLIPNQVQFRVLEYSRSENMIYGETYTSNQIVQLVKIDPSTAAYTVIKEYPSIPNFYIFEIIPDEQHNRLFLRARDTYDGFILTTDMNGNILSSMNDPDIGCLTYSYSNNLFYGSRINTSTRSMNLCIIDPASGTIIDKPNIPNIIYQFFETLDEVNGRYIFSSNYMGDSSIYLNCIDIHSGLVINKSLIPQRGIISQDNLMMFKYDNSLNKLIALFWEAKTINPPVVTVDSMCRLDTLTHIYPNPFNSSIFIDKAITSCQVYMNLYSTTGQLILKNKRINDGHNEIPLPILPSGTYFYVLISDNKEIQLSGKLIKD